nr:hypothetical protein [Sulfidibacter corallicola]
MARIGGDFQFNDFTNKIVHVKLEIGNESDVHFVAAKDDMCIRRLLGSQRHPVGNFDGKAERAAATIAGKGDVGFDLKVQNVTQWIRSKPKRRGYVFEAGFSGRGLPLEMRPLMLTEERLVRL